MKFSEEKTLSILVDWCNKGERCRFDIERKLKRWGADSEFITICTQRLNKGDLFNDSRFASAYAHDKSALQRWGIQKIKMNLKARGIKDEYIQRAIEHIEPEVHNENLKELATRKWPSIKGKNDYERTVKLVQFLMRRGFPYDTIKKVLPQKANWLDEINPL